MKQQFSLYCQEQVIDYIKENEGSSFVIGALSLVAFLGLEEEAEQIGQLWRLDLFDSMEDFANKVINLTGRNVYWSVLSELANGKIAQRIELGDSSRRLATLFNGIIYDDEFNEIPLTKEEETVAIFGDSQPLT